MAATLGSFHKLCLHKITHNWNCSILLVFGDLLGKAGLSNILQVSHVSNPTSFRTYLLKLKIYNYYYVNSDMNRKQLTHQILCFRYYINITFESSFYESALLVWFDNGILSVLLYNVYLNYFFNIQQLKIKFWKLKIRWNFKCPSISHLVLTDNNSAWKLQVRCSCFC